MMFKHFQFSTIHQSLELVLKAKDIFIKLNNTLILPRVEGLVAQDCGAHLRLFNRERDDPK
mgnify:CR=1 FL=1